MLRNTILLTAFVSAGAALVAVALTPGVCVAYDHSMISLAGTPEQIGTICGVVNAENIRHDFQEAYLNPAYAAGLTDQDLLDRSVKTLNIFEQMAPHWLDEARAVAAAAGVDEDLYLSYIDGVVRNRFLLPDCTAYAVPPPIPRTAPSFSTRRATTGTRLNRCTWWRVRCRTSKSSSPYRTQPDPMGFP